MKNLSVILVLLFLVISSFSQDKAFVDNLPAVLREKPDITGNEILTIKNNEEILITDYVAPYFKVKYNEKEGYVRITMIKIDEQMALLGKKYKINLDSLKSVLNPKVVINSNTPLQIGMSANTVRQILGAPDSNNKSTSSSGVREQWVYSQKNMYVYFENGILTSFQETK